jgi:F-type H+-transporting ATPase subunit b
MSTILLFRSSEVLAAESPVDWRPIYDEVLLWINFGIIVFVFVKYGKTPLMNFLRGRKEKLAQEIKQIEEEKEKVADKIRETSKMLEDSNIRFVELKDKIVEQGEKRKQEIIEEAKQHSKIILEGAQQKIDNQIIKAKNRFKTELVDAAIALAIKKLPAEIAEADNDKLLNQYLTSLMAEQEL